MTTERRRSSDTVTISPAELTRLLRRQLRRGLRASRLLDCPTLVGFLAPQHEAATNGVGDELHATLQSDLFDRALKAEATLIDAISRIGGSEAEALRVLGGVDDGTTGLSFSSVAS